MVEYVRGLSLLPIEAHTLVVNHEIKWLMADFGESGMDEI